MFEVVTTPSGCSFGSMPHSAHEWREGFLWWRKRKSCPGIERLKRIEYKKQLIELPFEPEVPKPHKHTLRFNGYAWTGKSGEPFRNIPRRQKDIMFICEGCPVGFEARVTRWAFEEMLLNKKVDQIWPG
ncbi:hypothetical protein SEA_GANTCHERGOBLIN_73 [Arthrobacter phage GantcherGoblin]|nr:hypothetical protein SEA_GANTCHERGOBLIN_73 [Arthrobacter phage GantcherGoblin]